MHSDANFTFFGVASTCWIQWYETRFSLIESSTLPQQHRSVTFSYRSQINWRDVLRVQQGQSAWPEASHFQSSALSRAFISALSHQLYLYKTEPVTSCFLLLIFKKYVMQTSPPYLKAIFQRSSCFTCFTQAANVLGTAFALLPASIPSHSAFFSLRAQASRIFCEEVVLGGELCFDALYGGCVLPSSEANCCG